MKYFLIVVALVLQLPLFSQTTKVAWGENFGISTIADNFSIIAGDASGLYLQENENRKQTSFLNSDRINTTLIKVNNNLEKVYSNFLSSDLSGRKFNQYFLLKDKLYILADDYSKMGLELSARPIDKATGKIKGEWKVLASYSKQEKKEDIRYRIIPNADSSAIALIGSIEGADKNELSVQLFNSDLSPMGNPIVVNTNRNKDTYQLQDVLVDADGTMVLVANTYYYEDTTKKKTVNQLAFENLNIKIYDPRGILKKEVNTDIGLDNRWLLNCKVVQSGKTLTLCGFYSNTARAYDVNGILVERIDLQTGELISGSHKAITATSFEEVEEKPQEEDKDEMIDKKSLQAGNDGPGVSRNFHFRNIHPTPDNGFLIFAEDYAVLYQTDRSVMYGISTDHLYRVYFAASILMVKVDSAGIIQWINLLPKYQAEKNLIRGPDKFTSSFCNRYFDNDQTQMPYFIGMQSFTKGPYAYLFFNDRKENEEILKPGKPLYKIRNIKKTSCFMVQVNMATGTYTRKIILDNIETPIAMPRLGAVIGSDFYMPRRKQRLVGDAKVAIAKITVQ